ncbi:MAG TPA: hypothetical protein VN682_25825 [Terriglobales bacterium]|nr:hypothetical protein [Terriglobales bacterium]
MKYTKPEISAVSDATQAIQGSKTDPFLNDGHSIPPVGTAMAYEADE